MTLLCDVRASLESSQFFLTHEFVGTSLLLAYDETGDIGAWLIDFAKNVDRRDCGLLSHRVPWVMPNHEDGVLFGIDQLIDILHSVVDL